MAASNMLRSGRAGTKLLNLCFSASTNLSFSQTTPLSKSLTTTSAAFSLKDNFLQATGSKTSRTVVCRTSENDPRLHNQADQGLFYTIPDTDAQTWLHKTFSPEFRDLARAFTETAMMVREPALEVMDCLKRSNMALPVNRYVLFGHHGCGKSMTMAHLMHYCASQDWLLVHLPWAASLNRYSKEVSSSTTYPDFQDQPLDASEWLSYFKKMNINRLKALDLKMTTEHVWNKRESAEIGSPLLETIEFGITRSKYACDAVAAVFAELKSQAASGGFNVLVAVDGVNAFWERTTLKRQDDKKRILAEELSLVKHFKSLMENDWAGGAVVCSVDSNAADDYPNRTIFTPRALLKKQGFEFLDPFIPIHVPNYSAKEAHSCLEYYTDRNWITNPHGLTDDGKQEMIHLSCNNPAELYRVSKMW